MSSGTGMTRNKPSLSKVPSCLSPGSPGTTWAVKAPTASGGYLQAPASPSGGLLLETDCAGTFAACSLCPSSIGFWKVSFLVLFFPSKPDFASESVGSPGRVYFSLSAWVTDAARPHRLLKCRALLGRSPFGGCTSPQRSGLSLHVHGPLLSIRIWQT